MFDSDFLSTVHQLGRSLQRTPLFALSAVTAVERRWRSRPTCQAGGQAALVTGDGLGRTLPCRLLPDMKSPNVVRHNSHESTCTIAGWSIGLALELARVTSDRQRCKPTRHGRHEPSAGLLPGNINPYP